MQKVRKSPSAAERMFHVKHPDRDGRRGGGACRAAPHDRGVRSARHRTREPGRPQGPWAAPGFAAD